jgi:hypothetical protein
MNKTDLSHPLFAGRIDYPKSPEPETSGSRRGANRHAAGYFGAQAH